MKDKKAFIITNAFQKCLDESKRKPNKIWDDKGSEVYNTSMKSWLQKNGIEMYSAQNEGKSAVTEKFIRTLKNNVYKYMTPISNNAYINQWDDIITKYSNTYHGIIKMKHVDVKSSTYFDSCKEINDEDPKFKICEIVKI